MHTVDASTTPSRALWVCLGLKAFLMTAVILYAGIGLGPDEAQYWTWSRALDWGYYSKPPGIAWQIWLGTLLFGQTEWAIRSMVIPLAAVQAWLIYRLALATGLLAGTALWCSLLMAFCPLGIFGSFFAITDVGFLLFWTGACWSVVSALSQQKAPDPLQIGAWILGGALFKWPIYFFWLFFFLSYYRRFVPPSRLRVAMGFLLSLAGLLPSLWWNASHDWATFRHIWATLQGGSGQKAIGNPGEFLGLQALLLSPLLFLLLLCALWHTFRQWRHLPPPLFFCGLVTLASLGMACTIACFQKVQGNWITLAYPTAFIVLGWDVFQEHPRRARWAKLGLGLSLGLTTLLFSVPSLYTHPSLSVYAPPYPLNSLKHNMGWDLLSSALTRMGYNPTEHFLFSDKYQTTSLLSFYPEQKQRAYFLNLQGTRKNQFSYWTGLEEEQQGKTGYFVWVENMPHLRRNWQEKLNFYQSELPRYFESVEFLGLTPLVYDRSTIAKAALIFRCKNCLGSLPPDPSHSLY